MATNNSTTATSEPVLTHSEPQSTTSGAEAPSAIPLPPSTTSVVAEESDIPPPPTTSSGHPNDEAAVPVTQAENTPALPTRPSEHPDSAEEQVPPHIAPLKAMFPDFDVGLLCVNHDRTTEALILMSVGHLFLTPSEEIRTERLTHSWV